MSGVPYEAKKQPKVTNSEVRAKLKLNINRNNCSYFSTKFKLLMVTNGRDFVP